MDSLIDLVVHLFRAVKHIYHDAQGPPEVFGSLGFTGASWTRWGATHSQMEGLGQSYVTPIGDGKFLLKVLQSWGMFSVVQIDLSVSGVITSLFVFPKYS